MHRSRVPQQVTHSGRQVGPAGSAGGLDHFRVEPGDVGRRHQIKPLPHAESHNAFTVRIDFARAEYDALSPFLAEQYSLSDQTKRGLPPCRMHKAVVARGRIDAFSPPIVSARGGTIALSPFALAPPFETARLRVRRPIHKGGSQRVRRRPAGEMTLPVVQHAIEVGRRCHKRRRRWSR